MTGTTASQSSGDPIASVRQIGDAVRVACELEATAPKPGNVHPAASFGDLTHADFMIAARITADEITSRSRSQSSSATDDSLGRRVRRVCQAVRDATGTNVNLGITLLLTPLVMAAEHLHAAGRSPDRKAWRDGVADVLSRIDESSSRDAFAAIAIATPGGMELPADDPVARSMDATDRSADHSDLSAAMAVAADRDRIACQYRDGFADVFDHVAPLIDDSVRRSGDWTDGIVAAHVSLLADQPDSLIIRKRGIEAARTVQSHAARTDPRDPVSLATLDRYLRSDGHALNPGTTADLIAAGLMVLLWQRCQGVETAVPVGAPCSAAMRCG